MVNKKKIAIIPARGGSKRIPKKNIIDFFGKPMIAWTIQAAIDSLLFDRVIVSTDDLEIAKVSEQYGASVPFLRKHYADDISPVSLATYGTIAQLQQELGETYEVVTQLMPNCPIRSSKDIQKAHQSFEERKAVSQLSCFKFGWMNPWWAFELDDSMRSSNLFGDSHNQRSQDLPPLYCPTGAVWISTAQSLIDNKTYYVNNRTYSPMEWTSAVDIDDLDDLKMAEAVFKMLNYK